VAAFKIGVREVDLTILKFVAKVMGMETVKAIMAAS